MKINILYALTATAFLASCYGPGETRRTVPASNVNYNNGSLNTGLSSTSSAPASTNENLGAQTNSPLSSSPHGGLATGYNPPPSNVVITTTSNGGVYNPNAVNGNGEVFNNPNRTSDSLRAVSGAIFNNNGSGVVTTVGDTGNTRVIATTNICVDSARAAMVRSSGTTAITSRNRAVTTSARPVRVIKSNVNTNVKGVDSTTKKVAPVISKPKTSGAAVKSPTKAKAPAPTKKY